MATKKTEAVEETVETTEAVEETVKAKAPKKVKIRIPRTRSESEDVYVALNGKSYLIKRGVEVEVPAGVAEILQHSEDMLAVAMEFEAQAAEKAK